MDAYYDAASQLPRELSSVLLRLAPEIAQEVSEIRLRCARPLVLSTSEGPRCITADGRVQQAPSPQSAFVSRAQLTACFHAVCGYSVHSFESNIASGFVPLPGGHRAGICGTAYRGASGFAIKDITSINIRIARAALCRCDTRVANLLRGAFVGLVVAGAPGSGKTTLLRAVAAELSAAGRRTAVVDERFEIAPVVRGAFSSTPPLHCDVLSGYPKHVGMQHALRALSPDVIVCDEVGAMEDIAAIEQAANAGTGLVVSIHASCREMLARRPQYSALLRTGAFTHVAFLRGAQTPGKISEVLDAELVC